MKYLNLGCGYRFNSDWTNVDFNSTSESVIAHNLIQGIPFSDASFDVVYHSHLLEHFPKHLADKFLKECYRVLRPQGILRIVVPDLEQLAKIYLFALEKANSGSQEWAANYEWILLEMYDQTVREQSGGEMLKYLFKESIPNEKFILERIGIEGNNLIESGRQKQQQLQSKPLSESQPKRLLKQAYQFFRYSTYRRESFLKFLLGKEYSALEIGRFRQRGEVHQWMYDCYSLTSLLGKYGFDRITQQTANSSYIPEWTRFNLDTEQDGTVYKPDSLFIEAIKLS